MKNDTLSDEVHRSLRSDLAMYRQASPINREYLVRLLDYIEAEFGILPRQSDTGLICFRPSFCCILHAGKREDCNITISLEGRYFNAAEVKTGKIPPWRKHDINNFDDFLCAKRLIREAHQYREAAVKNKRLQAQENLDELARKWIL